MFERNHIVKISCKICGKKFLIRKSIRERFSLGLKYQGFCSKCLLGKELEDGTTENGNGEQN